MIFATNLYTHADGECEFTTSQQTLYDDAERPIGWIERWNILGHLMASGPTAISTAQATLRAAYVNPVGISWAGLFDSSSNVTNHYIADSQTVSGIRVVAPPGFPNGTRIDFVNDRTYVLTLEFEQINTYARDIIAWTETVSQQGGGGQRTVAIETRYDLPVIQRVSRNTPIRIVQQGAAVGRFKYPDPPDCYLPDYLNDAESNVERVTPKLRGNHYERYEVRWTYVMNVAQVPGPAFPGKWPKTT